MIFNDILMTLQGWKPPKINVATYILHFENNMVSVHLRKNKHCKYK